MQVWSVPTAPVTPRAPARDVGAALVGCIARDDFATRTLAELNRALPVAWWTVYRVFDDQPPRLFAQASHAVPDIALDCWRIYRDGVYRGDTHFADACERAASALVMTHCRAEDFGRAHREQIYTAHSLSERLSLVSSERSGVDTGDALAGSGALLAVNLYRHRDQPRFAPAELDRVLEFGATLLAVVQRHIELADARMPPAERLRRLCPELTPRELAVCERLLNGMSFDGIAADLGISVATAKTYRNRAFERLGIQHRNALYALALPGSA